MSNFNLFLAGSAIGSLTAIAVTIQERNPWSYALVGALCATVSSAIMALLLPRK